MKMSIPKKVNVLGHFYKVIWVEPETLTQNQLAQCEYPSRIIRLSKELTESKPRAWIYFLHELRHAFQFEHGTMQIIDAQALELDADSFASFITSLQIQRVL